MLEGRAGSRAAVVRPAPEAVREPLWGGRARQAVHQAGRERRRGATRRLQRRYHPHGKPATRCVRAKRGRAGKRDAMGRGKLEGRGSHREACVCRRVNLVLCCNGNNQAYAPRDNPASFRRVVRGAQAGHWRGFFASWISCH